MKKHEEPLPTRIVLGFNVFKLFSPVNNVHICVLVVIILQLD
jgi:hypothetical protein